ncbi:MAG: hypothetical protein JHC38_08820 [Thiotrichales bacterium]|nr:hypothetical protein [Thiotrichales bacterium]
MNPQVKINENISSIIKSLRRFEAFETVAYLGFSEECPDCEVIHLKTKGAYRFPWKSRKRIEEIINQHGYALKYEYGCECGSYDTRDLYIAKR